MRRTKTVCTIGPATAAQGRLERRLRAGMDVARLNFSHGTHAQHAEVIARLRALVEKPGRPRDPDRRSACQHRRQHQPDSRPHGRAADQTAGE